MNDIVEITKPSAQNSNASGRVEPEPGANVSGMVFDGRGQAIATALFHSAESREAILAKMVEALKPNLKPMPQRYNSTFFEVYVGNGVSGDITEARQHGSAIGFVEYDPMCDSTTVETVDECGADYGYPLRDDIYLSEKLDVSDVNSWSTRKILRFLDRLMEEHWFIDEHGLMAPFDEFGGEMSRSHDALIRNELQRHARISDRIFTRIFALCATLMGRDQMHLATDFEFDFALNCTNIDAGDHPGISNWHFVMWDNLLLRLEYSRAR